MQPHSGAACGRGPLGAPFFHRSLSFAAAGGGSGAVSTASASCCCSMRLSLYAHARCRRVPSPRSASGCSFASPAAPIANRLSIAYMISRCSVSESFIVIPFNSPLLTQQGFSSFRVSRAAVKVLFRGAKRVLDIISQLTPLGVC